MTIFIGRPAAAIISIARGSLTYYLLMIRIVAS
jgi:hypothetical protein